MKKANFNTLKNLSVPESWIENALAIPEKEEQKPAAVPFWKKPRFIAMAASLVLVSALSIALFLSMGSKPPVAVKSGPQSSATEIIWSTDEYGATVATEVAVVENNQNGTEPTEAKSGIVRFFERLFGADDNTAPTTAPDRSSGTANTTPATRGRTNPTTKPNATESVAPSVKPTESGKPSDLPTETPTEDDSVIPNGPGGWEYEKPTEEPTESPTESPWAIPTELSWEEPTEAGGQPIPTDPPKPTQSRYKPTIDISVSGFTVTRISQDGNVVYCRIYDDDGNSYGDSDRYSDQHIAQMKSASYGRTLSYSPRDYGILPEDGYYRFEFYTAVGRVVASGSAYLSAT